MLAQLNSKQKSIFLNIKPTVIDKLISKNKSSFHHNLLYDNDASDQSLSEDSEESSSSSQESSPVSFLQLPATMAPMRRSAKVGVLGSKLSSSQYPIKRGPGRPPKTNKNNKNIKVIAAKKVLESSRRGSPRKICKDVSSPVKLKRKMTDTGGVPVNIKQSRTSVRKEISTNFKKTKTSKSSESTGTEKIPKVVKEIRNINTDVEQSTCESKVLKRQVDAQTSSLPSFDSKSSPRKFPSNVMDHWKSTGMVIRGRGRPRGSNSRGSFRGRILRNVIRSDRCQRYNTRDSQIGLMRSGKRRKCNDPNLVDGLDRFRKRRRVVDRIKRENNEYFSDEQSSFVTTSELSFCENDISRESDNETENSKLVVVKKEVEETPEENSQVKDTNSNNFKSKIKIKREHKTLTVDGSEAIDGSITSKISKEPKRLGQSENKVVSPLERPLILKTETNVRDSDCSLDSDVPDDSVNSSKLGVKHYRRKGIDGTWVRRSTRSIGKHDKVEPNSDVVDVLKEKDYVVDLDTNSKSSSVGSVLTKSDTNVTVNSTSQSMDMPDKQNSIVIETKIKTNNKDTCTGESNYSIALIKEEVKPDERSSSVSNDPSNVIENDQLIDFTLSFEETPVKNPDISLLESCREITQKLNFDTPCNENTSLLTSVKATTNTNNLLSPKIVKEFKDCMSEQVTTPISNGHVIDGNTQSKSINEIEDNLEKCIVKDNHLISLDREKDCIGKDNELISLDQKRIENTSNISRESSNDTNTKESNEVIQNKIIFNNDEMSESPSVSENIKLQTVVDDCEERVILESVNAMTIHVEQLLMLEQLHTVTKSSELKEVKAFVSFQDPERLNSKSDFKTIETSIDLKSYLFKNVENNSYLNTNLNADNTQVTGNDDKITNNYENQINTDADKSLNKAPESSEESSSDSNSNLSEPISTQFENTSTEANILNGPDIDRKSNISIENPMGNITCKLNVDGENIEKESEGCYSQSQGSSYTSLESSESNSMDTNKESICGQSNILQTISGDRRREERPSKELLSALGLQSLQSISEDKPKRPSDNYTGTLKAVIKLNRSSDKKSGGGKMIFKQCDKLSEDPGGCGDRLEYRIRSTEELATEGVPLTHLADIPANRKGLIKVKSQFDLSNSPNIVGAGGSLEITDSNKETGSKQNLIIPEKSSSFSIHPERLCTDVCSYCFGKFGSLDTPCHLAQLKNSERQSKILAIEVHLSADSCLCDGCFRYVDRKANCPTSQRSRKPAAKRGPLAGTICAVQECTQPARHSVRRKWLIKLKKSIGKKLVIDMDKNPHLPFPLCSQHYYWVDYFTVCGICKKRLTRNHMYALGPEADELNKALCDDGIPVRLSDKLFLCKLCRYYSSLRLKYKDPSSISSTHRLFLNSYRKKILHYHDIPISESEEEGKSLEEECNIDISKPKKKKSKLKSLDGHETKKKGQEKGEKSDHGNEDRSNDSQMIDYSYLDTLNVHREENPAPTVDYNSLGDFESQVGFSNIASFLNPLDGSQGTSSGSRADKPTRIQVKFGNLNIGKLSNLNIGQDSRQANSSTTPPERPPFLPGERELKLSGEFEFHGSLSPSSCWERCTSTIQFDRDTKKLWQELQRPYGNQSSFLRHLVMLEKHWRNGSLVLSENPNPRAVKYINSVRNRVQAYDGAKSQDLIEEQPKQPEVSIIAPPPRPMSTPIKNISVPPPLMKITPGTAPWLQDQLRRPPPYVSMPTSSQVTSTKSRLVPITTAPPPYRLSVAKPYQMGPRTIRLPVQSPYTQANRNPHNTKPLSISYQQFKKIRLEQVPASTNQVTVIPKMENVDPRPSTSSAASSSDFVPLISDVRSLASTESDWNESFRKQQQKMLKQNVAKYYAPILPKVPHSLTVTTFPQSSSAVVMKTSSLTIEKAPNISTKPNISIPEKPSISVFRETTHTENG